MDVPVTVSNDANAAAYGELVYGGAKGMKNFITFNRLDDNYDPERGGAITFPLMKQVVVGVNLSF